MKASRQRGFSLIELAVVLAILGVLIGAVIRPIITDNENAVINESRAVLDEARESLLAYVASRGYLPCPANDTSNGQEALNPGAGFDHTTGNCVEWNGFLPAAALGLTAVDAQGYAVDGGHQPHNRIRYAVSNQAIAGIANPFTADGALRRVAPALAEAEQLLYVCTSGTGVAAGVDCGAAGTLTSRAVAVVWSSGGNALTGGTSVDEMENPNPKGGSKDRIFVSRPRSVVAGAEFDDILVWVPTTVLVNRLLAAGAIP